MSEKVVFLAFTNPEKTTTEAVEFLVCRRCTNKTFTAVYDPGNPYPMLKCAACGDGLGRFGWAPDPTP